MTGLMQHFSFRLKAEATLVANPVSVISDYCSRPTQGFNAFRWASNRFQTRELQKQAYPQSRTGRQGPGTGRG
jgi:hypothetical protein